MTSYNKKLIAAHVLIMLLIIPYAFLSWLMGIIAGVYSNPIYWLNLACTALYWGSALLVLLSLLSKRIRMNERWVHHALRLPFIALLMAILCFLYLLIRYR